MTAERLRELLRAAAREWPAPIETLAAAASTNDEVRERARRGAPSWSVVLAETQTAGRGRRGGRWESPAGGLYLSVLLPVPPAEVAGLVPIAAGVAAAEALAAAGVSARLKWPNDVLAEDGRKLAGLLVEAASGPAGLELLVLGVGVNLAAPPGGFAGELRARAAGLAELAGEAPDRLQLAAGLLARLHDRHRGLQQGQAAGALDAWRRLSVPWWGKPVEVVSGGQVVRGDAVDLDPSGALVLRSSQGELVRLFAGEARELRLGKT